MRFDADFGNLHYVDPQHRDAASRGRRRRGDRGASLVEFALVVPIFLLLIFGIVDFGLVLNDYNSVRQGVREGAREGVVANFDGSCASGSSSARLICLTEDRIGLDRTRVRTRIQLETTYQVGEQLTVCSQVAARSTTGFFSPVLSGKVLRSKITMRIERIDASNPLTNLQETAPSGSNWSWC